MPFVDVDEATQRVDRDRTSLIIRLSSSVAGCISVTHFSCVMQRVVHTRLHLQHEDPQLPSPFDKKMYASIDEMVHAFESLVAEECCICLGRLLSGQKLSCFSCKHIVHQPCWAEVIAPTSFQPRGEGNNVVSVGPGC